MGITLTTPVKEITDAIEGAYYERMLRIVRALSIVGERCVNLARRRGGYKDRTGNLRSSVGYCIAVDGAVVSSSSFRSVKGVEPSDGSGSRTGREYAEKLARENRHYAVLVVVAGMDYAAYVADHGYDVLDSAELAAERIMPSILKQLGLAL